VSDFSAFTPYRRRPAAARPAPRRAAALPRTIIGNPNYIAENVSSAPREKPRSLGRQFLDAGKGIFTGAVELGVSVPKTVVGLGRGVYDVGRTLTDDDYVAGFTQNAIENPGNFGAQFSKNFDEYLPTFYMLGQGLDDTAKNVPELAYGALPDGIPGGYRWGGRPLGETAYGRAAKEGRIVDTVVNDLGSIALVGGAASAAAGSAAGRAATAGSKAAAAGDAARAASLAGRSAKLTNIAEKASFAERPIRSTLKRGASSAYGRFVPEETRAQLPDTFQGAYDQAVAAMPAKSYSKRLAGRFTTDARNAKEAIAQERAQYAQEAIDFEMPRREAVGLLTKRLDDGTVVDDFVALQEVARGTYLNYGKVRASARRSGVPELWEGQKQRLIAESDGQLTDRQLELAADVYDARFGGAEATPDVQRVEQALQIMNDGEFGSAARTRQYVEEEGKPEQIMAEPMQPVIEGIIDKNAPKIDRLATLDEFAVRRMNKEQGTLARREGGAVERATRTADRASEQAQRVVGKIQERIAALEEAAPGLIADAKAKRKALDDLESATVRPAKGELARAKSDLRRAEERVKRLERDHRMEKQRYTQAVERAQNQVLKIDEKLGGTPGSKGLMRDATRPAVESRGRLATLDKSLQAMPDEVAAIVRSVDDLTELVADLEQQVRMARGPEAAQAKRALTDARRALRDQTRRLSEAERGAGRVGALGDRLVAQRTAEAGKRVGGFDRRTRYSKLAEEQKVTKRRTQRAVDNLVATVKEASETGAAVPAIIRPLVQSGDAMRKSVDDAVSWIETVDPDAGAILRADMPDVIDTLTEFQLQSGRYGLANEGQVNLDQIQFLTQSPLTESQRKMVAGKADAYAAGQPKPGLPRITNRARNKYRSGDETFVRGGRAQILRELNDLQQVSARRLYVALTDLDVMQRVTDYPEVNWADVGTAKLWLDENNLTLMNPRNPFGEIREWSPELLERGELRVMDRNLFLQVKGQFSEGPANQFFRNYWDKPTGRIKNGLLALSPAWQIGNVIGNALMATIVGGVDPVTMTRSIIDSIDVYRNSTYQGRKARTRKQVIDDYVAQGIPRREAAQFARSERNFGDLPDRVMDSRLGSDLRDVTSNPLLDTNMDGFTNEMRARLPESLQARPVKSFVGASYRVNGLVDGVYRSALYNVKYQNQLAKGIDDVSAREMAAKETMNALGDFAKMTDLERNVIRRIIPFYAWIRHANVNLFMRFPWEHPFRAAWALNLGAAFGDRDGLLRLNDEVAFDVNYLNPWADLGGIATPDNIARSTNPLLKGIVGATTGVNLSRGFRGEFTRPYGTGNTRDGRAISTPPSLMRQTLNTFAPRQTRLAEGLMGRGSMARYDSGDPMIVGGRTIDTDVALPGGNRTASLMGYFGARPVQAGTYDDRRKRAATRETEYRQAGQRYSSQRKRLGV
jgi:hypothetical protein